MINPFITGKRNYLILVFTIVYLAAFTFNGVLNANFEFLYYTFLLSFLIYLVIYLHQRLHLGFFILFNLSLLGFLHLAGGNFYLGDLRLYDYYFIPYIFKYDNMIHSYGTFIGTWALYSLLISHFREPVKKRFPVLALLLIFMAIGMGTIVELVEFLAVIIFGVAEQVGDYYNNTLDLLFNFLGSVLATVIIYFYQYRPKFILKIDGSRKKSN